MSTINETIDQAINDRPDPGSSVETQYPTVMRMIRERLQERENLVVERLIAIGERSGITRLQVAAALSHAGLHSTADQEPVIENIEPQPDPLERRVQALEQFARQHGYTP